MLWLSMDGSDFCACVCTFVQVEKHLNSTYLLRNSNAILLSFMLTKRSITLSYSTHYYVFLVLGYLAKMVVC